MSIPLDDLVPVPADVPDDVSIASTDAIVDSTNGQVPTEAEINPELASLMAAAQEGDLARVQELVPVVGVQSSFSDGITALHWAALNNRLDVVRYLVEQGADCNVLGGDLKASPLHWAARNGLVYVVDHLVRVGKADVRLRDAQSYNALHLAVHSSSAMLVVYMLVCTASEVDEVDVAQRTALHWAAYQGDLLSIKALLHYGADVTKVDSTLFTPLHWGFIRGQRLVLKALVEAGSDIFVKNDQGKDSFGVAKDMACEETWERVLREDGRKASQGYIKTQHDSRTAKVATFLVPYLLLPVCLYVCSLSQGNAIPKLAFCGALTAGVLFATDRFVVASYVYGERALSKSPLMSGIFSGTAFWAILIWAHTLAPRSVFLGLGPLVANVALALLIVAFSWSFFKTMFINPGYVPVPSDRRVIRTQVEELVERRKLTPDHFCVDAFVRRPIRSRYSHSARKLIARFDHYCPWVYNDIGVRNHKLFMVFAYSLWAAIVLFAYLSTTVFAHEGTGEECTLLSANLCYGAKNHHFVYNTMVWCLFQFVWISLLCVSQTFQICKGITSWEYAQLNRTRHSHRPCGTFFSLIGLDTFLSTLGSWREPIVVPSDYGVVQNWLDFWVLGEVKWRNVFYLPIGGENNLGGEVVDYYRVWEWRESV